MCPQHGAPACQWCRTWNRGVARCCARGHTGHAPAGAVAACLPVERDGPCRARVSDGYRRGRDERRRGRCRAGWRRAARRWQQEQRRGRRNWRAEGPADRHRTGWTSPGTSGSACGPREWPDGAGGRNARRTTTTSTPRSWARAQKRSSPAVGYAGRGHEGRGGHSPRGPHPPPPSTPPLRDGRAEQQGELGYSPRAERASRPQGADREHGSGNEPPPPPRPSATEGEAEARRTTPGTGGRATRTPPLATPPPPHPRGHQGGRGGGPGRASGAQRASRDQYGDGNEPTGRERPRGYSHTPRGRPATPTGHTLINQGAPPPPPSRAQPAPPPLAEHSRPRAVPGGRRHHQPGRGERSDSGAGRLHPPESIHHRPRLAGAAATAGRQGSKPEGRTPVRPSRGVHRG